MTEILFLKRLKENVRASSVILACVFMIALLTGACASEYKKQTLSSANESGQVSAKSESQNGETNDGQELVCRTMTITGSRIKKTYCATKEQWAVMDKKNRKESEEFMDDVNDDAVYTPPETGPMGGQASRMPR
jgi:hypothetical protein